MTSHSTKNGIISPQSLREFQLAVSGHVHSQTVAAGCRLGLFEALAERPGQAREAVAKQLGISDYAARVLLLSCAALNLVERSSKGRYRNAPIADRFLLEKSKDNVLPAIEAHHAFVYAGIHATAESMRQGRHLGLQSLAGPGETLYKRLTHRPDLERKFQSWVQNIADKANPLLGRVSELRKVRHLLDVGGGNGANAIQLHRLFPHLRITIFDLPSVCRLARRNIAQHGLSGFISTSAGDFFTDPFPTGVDAIFFGHLVHIFAPERIEALLGKARAHLPRGGLVVCFQGMTDDDETGPLRSAELSIYFLALASGEGMVYPWKDFKRWFKKAGFSRTRTYRLNDPQSHGVVIGKK